MSSGKIEIEVDGVVQLAAVYRSPFLQTGGAQESDAPPLWLPLTIRVVDDTMELVVNGGKFKRRARGSPEKPLSNYALCARWASRPLAKWPDIWRVSANFMSGVFKNGRVRYPVGLIASYGVAKSIRLHDLRNPTDVEIVQAKKASLGVSEGELLRTTFTGYTWGEAEYRSRLLMPARNALLNAGWQVPTQDRTADELTTDEQCLVVTDDELRALQAWCHRLWFLLRPQLIK